MPLTFGAHLDQVLRLDGAGGDDDALERAALDAHRLAEVGVRPAEADQGDRAEDEHGSHGDEQHAAHRESRPCASYRLRRR